MMIKAFCDKCGIELEASNDGFGEKFPETLVIQDNPKVKACLCDPCLTKLKTIISDFLKDNGSDKEGN